MSGYPDWLFWVIGIYGIGFWFIYAKVHENEQSLLIQRREAERRIREEGGRELEPETGVSATGLLLGGWMIGWVVLIFIVFSG